MTARRVMLSANSAWNIANFRMGLIRGLKQAGYDVIVTAPADGHQAGLIEAGCHYIDLPMDNMGTNPLNDALLLARYYRLFRRERPDVFLGYTIKPNIFGSMAAGWCRVPVINNVSGLGTTFIRKNWLTKLVQHLYRRSLRGSFRVFFQNQDDEALFLQQGLVRAGQTSLLPGSGIDLQYFNPQPLADNGDGFVFLLVARLLWDKGVGEFVEAARILKLQFPKARFQLLGFLDVKNKTAVSREVLERWTRQGTIEYLGVLSDVRPALKAADCVVLPSYREGTPRSLLEAAALAKPLIASDVPGCRQVVDDGHNGLLCRVKDARDLADKMIYLMQLPTAKQRAMGLAGRSKMEQEFDEQIVIDAYLKVIRLAVQ